MGKYKKSKSAPVKKRKPQRRRNQNSKVLLWVLIAILIALIVFCLCFMPGLLYALRGGNEETQPQQTTLADQPSGGETIAPGESTAPQQGSQPQSSEPSGSTGPSQSAQTDPAPSGTTEPTAPSGTTAPVQSPQTVVSLPATLDGGLKLENLFQFSGLNPDAGNQEGTDIATVLLKNTSGSYLVKADLTVTLADGKKLTFTVTDLPPGQSAMAFSKENASIGASAACSAVSCSTTFEPGLVPVPAQVSVSINGTAVTLTNQTDQALSNLVVYCRCPLGEEYFGGITYQYEVKNLPPRGTVTVDAVDCILGMAEVVRVEINNE